MPNASNNDSLSVAITVMVSNPLLIRIGRYCWSWMDARNVFRLLGSVYVKGGGGDGGYDDCEGRDVVVCSL